MEAWPMSLPQTPYHIYEGAQASGIHDPESVLATARTRTYPEHTVTFTFRQITASQYATFRAWWDEALNQSLPFSAPWLSKAGFSHHFCRFDPDNPWTVAIVDLRFDLTIKVEVIATAPVDGEGNLDYWMIEEEE